MGVVSLGVDVTDAPVLVVGGGSVGARKARRFADAGARVVVVSPDFADADFGGAACVRAAPSPGDAAGWVARVDPVLVVVASSDDAVNDAFAAAARDVDALVNRADEPGTEGAGGVVVPATVEDGPVTVAVSTGGRSPALSKYLRDAVAEEIAGAGDMAELTGDLRAELQAADVPEPERRAAVTAVVNSWEVWKALRSGDSNARQEAVAVVESVVGREWST